MRQWSARFAGAVEHSWSGSFATRNRPGARLRAVLPEYSIEAFLASDIGCVRDSNQDSIAFLLPGESEWSERRGFLAVVADGMGGHNGGEVASALAVEAICRHYYLAPSDSPADRLALSMREANAAVFHAAEADPRLSGMGTTTTALALVAGQALVAHVGDSRLYRCREGQGWQLTTDDSLLVEMVNNGILSAEQARHHPARNVLLRSLGTQAKLWVLAKPYTPPPEPGDCFILCSDGLWESVEPGEMAQIVASTNVADSARRLVTLARDRDGSDNISVGVIAIRPT